MSVSNNKLDRSLDEILKSSETSRRNVARRDKPVRRGPAGGVGKKTSYPKGPAAKAPPAPRGGGSGSGDSKIILTNLPRDVQARMVEDYVRMQDFGKSVKDVVLAYDHKGDATGSCTISFRNQDAAYAAAQCLDGLPIDGIKIVAEVCVKTSNAPVKALSDRIGGGKPHQPKSHQPKSNQPKAVGGKNSRNGRGGRGGRGSRRGARGSLGNRPKKTEEQLDADMVDYFGEPSNQSGELAAGGGQPSAAQDAAMGGSDEML